MALKPELLSGIMERAMQEEIGLAVETNNAPRLQQYLADHRKQYNLTEYESLLFVLPSTPNIVFVTKRTVELDDA